MLISLTLCLISCNFNNDKTIKTQIFDISGQPLANLHGFVFDSDDLALVKSFRTDNNGNFKLNLARPQSPKNKFKYYNLFLVNDDTTIIYNYIINITNDSTVDDNSDVSSAMYLSGFSIANQTNITVNPKDQSASSIQSIGNYPATLVKSMASQDSSLTTSLTDKVLVRIVSNDNTLYTNGIYRSLFNDHATLTIPTEPLNEGSEVSFKTFFQFNLNTYRFNVNNTDLQIVKLEPGQCLGGSEIDSQPIEQNNVNGLALDHLEKTVYEPNAVQRNKSYKEMAVEDAIVFSYNNIDVSYSITHQNDDAIEVVRTCPDVTTYEYGEGEILFDKFHSK